MRIIIVSSDPSMQHELSSVVLKDFPSAHLAEAINENELSERIKNNGWDLVINSNDQFDADRVSSIRTQHAEHPQLPILVVSHQPEIKVITSLLTAGIAGYVDKASTRTELPKAIKIILQGRQYLTPQVEKKLPAEFITQKPPHEYLSAREFDVFKLLAAGKTVSEISTLLLLGITTVSTYRSRLMAKLGLKSNEEVIAYAKRHTLV